MNDSASVLILICGFIMFVFLAWIFVGDCLNDKTESINTTNESTSSDKQANGETPIVEADIPPTPRENSNFQGKKDYRLNRRRFVVEVITLVVLAGYAWVSYTLYETTKAQFQISQRPWVGLGAINVLQKLAVGKHLKIAIIQTNGGQSPAIGVVSHLDLVLGPMTQPIVLCPTYFSTKVAECFMPNPTWTDTHKGNLVLPKSDNTIMIESPDISDKLSQAINIPLSLPIPPSLQTGPPDSSRQNLFLVGCIDYFDEFGLSHRTKVCQFYAQPTVGPTTTAPFAICIDGNEAY